RTRSPTLHAERRTEAGLLDGLGGEDHPVHDLVERRLEGRERVATDAGIDEVAAEVAAVRLPRVAKLFGALTHVHRKRQQVGAPAGVVGPEKAVDGAGVAADRIE